MTHLAPTILAAAEGSFWTDVQFQLVGFFIVLLTLTGLWVCLEIIGSFFKARARREAAASAEAAAQVVAQQSDEDDPELYAVIAAAIDTVIRQSHQVVSISSRSGARGDGSNWSSEGRRDIYRTRTLR